MRIVSVVGTRPQFVKIPLLSRQLRLKHEEIIVHTGQHYDKELSAFFYSDLNIPDPDFNLNVGSGSHAFQIGNMLISMEKLLLKVKPELVIIYGDTNSTVAASIVASRLKIPLAHVESGLRNFDKTIPEEVNRLISDNLSDLLFCPTVASVENLRREGVTKGVYLTGDIMYDVLLHNYELIQRSDILSRLNLINGKFLLATIHRPRNTDDIEVLQLILEAFNESNERIIVPLHPRTSKIIKENNLERFFINKNITKINALGYLDFLKLMMSSKKVITDSGGVQKEAYILKKPCITLFNSTSWIETVENGWNVLVASNKEKIIENINEFQPKTEYKHYYGDGKAYREISSIIDDFIGKA